MSLKMCLGGLSLEQRIDPNHFSMATIAFDASHDNFTIALKQQLVLTRTAITEHQKRVTV
jgi:hypothetical protein